MAAILPSAAGSRNRPAGNDPVADVRKRAIIGNGVRTLKRLAAATLVLLAGAALASMVLFAFKDSEADEPTLRFRGVSSFAIKEVKECLLESPRGNKLFPDLEPVYVRLHNSMTQSTYLSPDSSRVIFSANPSQVVVISRSALSRDQTDLLEWCVENPELTWVRPSSR